MTLKKLFILLACGTGISAACMASEFDPEAVRNLIESLNRIQTQSGNLDSVNYLLKRETDEVRKGLENTEAEIQELKLLLVSLEDRMATLQGKLDPLSDSSQEEPFWSFRPLGNPSVPDVQDSWIRNPIDAFILEKHRELGLAHSEEADRRTLIRRLTYDLHGLPPSLDEVDSFLADESPNAYERLVDRLLASPRYGERWGRHWLDVVHYADTHGYDKDKRRPNAWPYRDYVIQSLNNDKPYPRFTKEQIAGDVLDPGDPMGVVATGFISAGPWDFVGHVELREGTKDKKITRNLDRDDMVMNTMSTFMSLTVHCARCHDHKFDPIEQEDYYSLQAVFAGVERANRPYDSNPKVFAERKRLSEKWKDLETQNQRGENWISSVTGEQLAELDARLADFRMAIHTSKEEASPTNGYHSAIEANADAIKWVQIDLGKSLSIDRVRLFPARPVDFTDTPGFGFPRRFKIEGATEESFSRSFPISDRTSERFPNPGDDPVEVSFEKVEARFIRITATELWERSNDFVFALGEMEIYSGTDRVSMGKPVRALDSIDSGRWDTKHLVDGYDSRKRIGAGGDDSRESLESKKAGLEAERRRTALEQLPEASRELIVSIEIDLASTKKEIDTLPEPQWVYSAASEFKPEGSFTPAKGPRPIHLLPRGDIERPGKEVSPAGLRILDHQSAVFAIRNPGDEGQRRAALADWIAHPDNPLFWRSIVNRVWHYHFGRGLVDTPNDFGKMGSTPTHADLLDWLAVAFRDQGGSLKLLHKWIVTSATYRQVSSGNRENEKVDAGNQYLWRMNRTRIDAESLRDTILAVTGKLDLAMGGPGYDLFGFIDDHSPHYLYQEHEVDKPESLRRTIYRFIVRSVPDPFMECLDCADPSQNVPVRNQTLTPLQSLALLNNPFTVRMTEHLASRLEVEASDLSGRIDRAYKLCLTRKPTEEERSLLWSYAQEHGLPAACRVLINSNEFLFVD